MNPDKQMQHFKRMVIALERTEATLKLARLTGDDSAALLREYQYQINSMNYFLRHNLQQLISHE